MEKTILSSGRPLWHHNKDLCVGGNCPLHNPSNHELREYNLDWHDDWKVMVRIVNGLPVVDPDDYRNTPGTILENRALCNDCRCSIASKHRHDFVSCPCGNLAVDGGRDYLRRVGDNWTEQSVVIH